MMEVTKKICKIKEEDIVELIYLPSPQECTGPPEGLIEFFLDSNYTNREEIEYYYSKTKWMDETDGNFKYYIDLASNVPCKTSTSGDYKNFCEKCCKKFDNALAVQRHYIFTHPDQSLLLSKPHPIKSEPSDGEKQTYDWLDQRLVDPAPPKAKEQSPNIIVLKDKDKLMKKLPLQLHKSQQQFTIENIKREFTIENIKRYPKEGIRVVKKSDIKFHRINNANKNSINKKFGGKWNDKQVVTTRSLPKQKCQTKLSPSYHNHRQVDSSKRPSKSLDYKYVCEECKMQTSNLKSFNIHMKMHEKNTFRCPYCETTYGKEVNVKKHLEECSNSQTSRQK